ncbi:hypothetical protein CcaverHIS002_0201730 [Cutaneotrichosporon cavernicola]|uniref:tRNA-splicing endonuclease subunit Sen15 domain-containing protein n=1 Tax=Cutaneotrichosporon cavernicola TaxID=279322 RepID=A0AA48I3A4_9TREE|nr:uncharacterized protein CcaverHIS019_0201760 [Cutaneotrichosporon cavernicola]BEI81013.1 hypothetical protein CcaverHIS002_0201730 [Cutaneotrichosporon cavernicola]BEI88814.1 hypothetical protein CcaverHIS019_0201760 [Cutaneotrichosporon cavernicola]BEI96589.1 hypothetical protein CcaverHIS631_0201780 [Cutaneotrichosporon cavernicola]BEJ04361.1 hypothetical protein CcaverHIS641_0201780 [Cutaneotrichosporon cavernicola]
MTSSDHNATTLTAHLGPLQRGPAATALRDLALAVGWCDLCVLELKGTTWSVLVGHKRKEDPLRAVLPLPLHTNALLPSELKGIFDALAKVSIDDLPPPITEFAPSVDSLRKAYSTMTGTEAEEGSLSAVGEEKEAQAGKAEFDPDTLYTAIMCADSTVVYYKLSRGIRKPHDIPDE